MKVSNPEGAVRVLRATMAKMAKDYKALERKLARVTAIKEREFAARVALEDKYQHSTNERAEMIVAIKDAICAMVGGAPVGFNTRDLCSALLERVRGAMRLADQQNSTTAELREKLKSAETLESSRTLTLAEDNAIVEALSESRLGDMPVVEAVAKAIRAEALEPIVVTRPSLSLGDALKRYEDAAVRSFDPHPMRYAREYGA